MNVKRIAGLIGALTASGLIVAGCATMASDAEISQRALAMMKSGFRESGQAKLDRLDQDDVQRTCSQYQSSDKLPKDVAQKLEETQFKMIKYPADGQLLGDWKAGEAIAQSGVQAVQRRPIASCGRQLLRMPSTIQAGGSVRHHRSIVAQLRQDPRTERRDQALHVRQGL